MFIIKKKIQYYFKISHFIAQNIYKTFEKLLINQIK